MSPALNRPLFVVFILLLLALATGNAQAIQSCDDLAQQNAHWQSELEGFVNTEQAFERFFQGRLPDDTLSISRVLAPIGVERSAAATAQVLQEQRARLQQNLREAIQLDVSLSCDEQAQLWQATRQQYVMAQLASIDTKLRLLQLAPANLRVLFRELKAWQNLQQVLVEVGEAMSSLSPADTANLSSHVEAIVDWSARYQNVLESWIPLLLADQRDMSAVNRVWKGSRSLKRVYEVTQWPQLGLAFGEDATRWQQTLMDARSELVLGISQWRNDAIWDAGWVHFGATVAKPMVFVDHAMAEVMAAPLHFWDNLSGPFLR
ncbi:MAG: hypothetical protein R3183_10725, partial [Oleiphilaceae bacterium]|nr:hypothetical protein [Oleiphilaceae bacterium]